MDASHVTDTTWSIKRVQHLLVMKTHVG